MKRITVPEPQIDLYNDGFEDHDLLGRAETGKKLSDLVERIDEPLVIALDGAWGSGKSHFLKCWVGYHKEHNEKTKTVYFDAFKHDYLDDPLVALTGEISRRFQASPQPEANEVESAAVQSRALDKLLQFGAFAGRNSGKIAVSFLAKQAQKALSEDTFDELSTEFKDALSDGISSIEGDAEALFDAKTGEAGTDDFWKAQRAKIASMEGFRLALKDLTEPVTKEQAQQDDDLTEGDPMRKLVIVIDELDRCRPDYALQLLEIIKHFFNVPGVHFVLGVNLKELQNSVRARYGEHIGASKYLQKFINLSMKINGSPRNLNSLGSASEYYRHVAQQTGFSASDLHLAIRTLIRMVNHHIELSLRDVERIVTKAASTPTGFSDTAADRYYLAALIIMSVCEPHLVEQARFNQLRFEEVERFFKLGNHRLKQNDPFREAHLAFTLLFRSVTRSSYKDEQEALFDGNTCPELEHLGSLIANRLDTFELPER